MIVRLLPIIVLVVFAVGLVLWFRAANAIAVLAIDDGKVRRVRGRLTAAQKRDVQEAVHLSGVREGRVRIVQRKQGLDVIVRPADEGLEQRLRNAVRTWS